MILQNTEKKTAGLLIRSYDCIDNLKSMILDSAFVAIDTNAPACRFRGTVVDARKGMNHITITGWQRNISRLRKMDVSLPAIVTLTLNGEGVVEEIELDGSFKGSKGLMCSRRYLNRNLKTLFQGKVFDSSFYHNTKVRKTHCFHLFEVLSGIYSYYRILKSGGVHDMSPRPYSYEEEAIDSYNEGDTLHSLGTHLFSKREPVHFRLTLHNILNNISFNPQGMLAVAGGIKADFIINGRHVLRDVVSLQHRNNGHMDLPGFLFLCIKQLKRALTVPENIRMFNTNLYPRAYIGMLIQSAAIRLFNNNYTYIMHAITSLQRTGNKPLCIGAVKNEEEATIYFPGFSFSDLL